MHYVTPLCECTKDLVQVTVSFHCLITYDESRRVMRVLEVSNTLAGAVDLIRPIRNLLRGKAWQSPLVPVRSRKDQSQPTEPGPNDEELSHMYGKNQGFVWLSVLVHFRRRGKKKNSESRAVLIIMLVDNDGITNQEPMKLLTEPVEKAVTF